MPGTLRSQLIRLASEDKALRPHLLPLLKEAMKSDTSDFITWAVLRDDKKSESEVQRFLEKVLGREPQQPAEGPSTRKTGPLEVGQKVLCDRYRNANEQNVDECEQYHDRVGVVLNVSTDGLTVQFFQKDTQEPEHGSLAFFNGHASGKATGLIRWTPKVDYQAGASRTLLEVVYLRGGTQEPPRRDREALDAYIERGLAQGEDRSDIYYSGYVGMFAISKEGNLYFTLSSQQRDRPTSISPVKGKVLYIGLMGKRPGGWKNDLSSMIPTVPAMI